MQFRFPQLDLFLDTEEGYAERGGAPLPLSPLSRRLLGYLAHNRDRIVPPGELLREVWEGVRVTDASRRQGLRTLRRELGPAARNGSVVEAVRGKGYRLATPVEELPEEALGLVPFVGRTREMEDLLRDLEGVRLGAGRLVLLSGPPGIGKTRLAEELADRAGRRGFRVLAGRCADHPGAPPLWPFEEALRALARLDPTWLDRVPEAEQSAIRAGLAGLEEASDAVAGPLPPGPTRFRFFEAVRNALEEAAEVHPVLLRLDDVHEADEASLALLEWLAGRLNGAPLMMLVAHRGPVAPREAFAGCVARMVRNPAVRQIELGPLERGDVERAARAFAPGLEAERLEALWRRSGGNPFFLRLCLDAGPVPGAERRSGVAPGVREAVLEHLAGLSQPTRDALAVASVLGLELRADVLTRVHGADERGIEESLGEAETAGFLQDEGGDGTWRFVHALVQEALYQSLDADARRRLHAQAARALEARDPGAVTAIAEHAFRGRGELSHAVVAERCVRAARAASERTAFEPAARLLERALGCTPPDETSRRLELLIELAEARGRAGDVATGWQEADEAAGLAIAQGDGAALARSVLALGAMRGTTIGRDHPSWVDRLERALATDLLPPAGRARLVSRLAQARWFQPPLEQARRLARESIGLAEASDDADALAEALAAGWMVLQTGRDDVSLRRELLDRMEAIDGRIEDRLLAQEMLSWRLVEAGRCLDRPGFEALAARIRQEAERIGGPHAAWWARVARTSLEQIRGRPDAAEREAARGLALGLELGLEVATPNHALQMLAIRRDQGRLAEAEPLLAHGAARQPNALAWTAAWRLAGTHAGAAGPARELLDGLCERELGRLPENGGNFYLLVLVAELAFELEHREAARQVRPLLEPFRTEAVFFALGFCGWGAAVHYAGRAALVLGELDAAIEELEAGIRADRAFGAPIPAARGQAVLATARARRAAPGDLEAAASLRSRVRALEADLGIRVRELAEFEAVERPTAGRGRR